MTEETMQAGNSIESKCLKCKEVTTHHVVVVVDGKVTKVQCKLCGGRHIYRSPVAVKTAKKPARPKKNAIPARRVPLVAEEWEKMFKSADSSRAIPYSMVGTFPVGAVIDHHTFGLGFTKRVIRPNKVEVLFKDSIKTLICVL